jgi:hypothetical protein
MVDIWTLDELRKTADLVRQIGVKALAWREANRTLEQRVTPDNEAQVHADLEEAESLLLRLIHEAQITVESRELPSGASRDMQGKLQRLQRELELVSGYVK